MAVAGGCAGAAAASPHTVLIAQTQDIRFLHHDFTVFFPNIRKEMQVFHIPDNQKTVKEVNNMKFGSTIGAPTIIPPCLSPQQRAEILVKRRFHWNAVTTLPCAQGRLQCNLLADCSLKDNQGASLARLAVGWFQAFRCPTWLPDSNFHDIGKIDNVDNMFMNLKISIDIYD